MPPKIGFDGVIESNEEVRNRAIATAGTVFSYAVEAEKNRLADELKAIKEAEDKRLADKEHKAKINRSIHAAFVRLGVSDELARELIVSIARGEIDNISINY